MPIFFGFSRFCTHKSKYKYTHTHAHTNTQLHMYYVDFNQMFPLCWIWVIEIVPRVSITDCAGSPNNRAVRCPKLSAIRLTAKTIFERWVLFPGTCHLAPLVTMPSVPTPPPFTLQQFLGFPVFSFNFVTRVVPQKCDLLGTCGNLAAQCPRNLYDTATGNALHQKSAKMASKCHTENAPPKKFAKIESQFPFESVQRVTGKSEFSVLLDM